MAFLQWTEGVPFHLSLDRNDQHGYNLRPRSRWRGNSGLTSLRADVAYKKQKRIVYLCTGSSSNLKGQLLQQFCLEPH